MVPHNLLQIEKAQSRMTNSVSFTDGSNILKLSDEYVLLDPVGNVPLKLYITLSNELHMFKQDGWIPPLRLTPKEKEVNAQSGTVLLLGRSGTGKTLCLCDRMSQDRLDLANNHDTHDNGNRDASVNTDASFRKGPNQLFVSRSNRLCEFVKEYQKRFYLESDLSCTDFMTLDKFIKHMDLMIRKEGNGNDRMFIPSRRVDFSRFRDNIYKDIRQESDLEPLVVWTQIRSFIKGSVEAVIQKSHLSLDQYKDVAVFGHDRCRLSLPQRQDAYVIYNRYENILKSRGLWDDGDRVLSLLIRSNLEPQGMCNGHGADYDKVYVDEVQDNTQAEIILYLLASGLNTKSLFLAGDPAQSVVEGVDFRFEDVRSVIYKLSDGKERINRPVKLVVNFRSHAGILAVAAAVLDRMLLMFPGAANSVDSGVFNGPRPVYYQMNDISEMKLILSKNQRLVIISPDEIVKQIEQDIGVDSNSNHLILGIREAKGLEFPDLMIVNFFSSMAVADQKAWKKLLAAQSHIDTILVNNFPQLESQLKVLYTAITRCCNRLVFVEDRMTLAGSAFFRWLHDKDLAVPLKISTMDEATMTSDEWRIRGIEFALLAEGDVVDSMLKRALVCFDHAGDMSLRMRTQALLDLEICRKKLNVISDHVNLQSKFEIDVSNCILRCIRAGLVSDTLDVCDLLCERSCEPRYFQQYVRQKLEQLCKLNN